MNGDGLDAHDQKRVEEALASLRPAASGLDREALMFEAGRASARRGARLWRGASGALAAALAVSVGLQVVALDGGGESPRYAATAGSEPPPPESPEPPGSSKSPEPPESPEAPQDVPAYLRLRAVVLTEGVDALPAPSPRRAPVQTPTVEQLLDLPPRRSSDRSSVWPLQYGDSL